MVRSKNPAIQALQLPVTGMSCGACALGVESVLKGEAGVTAVAVNYANATVALSFDPQQTDIQKLRDKVLAAGYDLIVAEAPEAAAAKADEIKDHALKVLRIRMLAAIALSIPLVLMGMVFMHLPYANYIMWGLATPIVFVLGQQFFVNAWKQARHGKANMDTLVALSTSIAYGFSVFNTLVPSFWTARGLEAHVYFEASGVIVAFILIGKFLEERAKSSTSSAIHKLMDLQPQRVFQILEDGSEREIGLDAVKIGDRLRVKPGQQVPVDGLVLAGQSFVDESMISGEPVAVEKTKGMQVIAGTINQQGSLELRADKVGAETLLAQIIRMVQAAQGTKAPVQKMVDKIAGIFVPVVMGIAVLSFLIWTIFGGENGLTHGLLAMVTVLVIACPCALGLATPTAIMVGMGKAAENGILIKDALSLEQAHRLNAMILDKTGTITEGKPKVSQVEWLDAGLDTAEAIAVLVAIESQSAHPLALAVTQHFAAQVKKAAPIEGFLSLTGMGAEARFQAEDWFVGNAALLAQRGIEIPAALAARQGEWEAAAQTVIFFAQAKRLLAMIGIADQIKAHSKAAVAALQDLGIEVYMLTGDNAKTAARVAEEVGIQHFQAHTLPADKAAFIQKLQAEGKVVGMVGDGINDAQALAQADVSIAMGKGSDIAMDVAAMTIISSDLMKLPHAITLSSNTVRTIRQNLFWAFVYNVVGIPIAAGILFPFNGFLLNPMLAGGAMALSSVSVVANSLRLKWQKI